MATFLRSIWLTLFALSAPLIDAKTLPLGISLNMSGTDAQYSLEFKKGIDALIHSENLSKRFGRYKLKLIAMDDKGQSHRALSNVKRLIKSKQVLTVLSTHQSDIVSELTKLAGNTKTLLLSANHQQHPLTIKELRYVGFLSAPYDQLLKTLNPQLRDDHTIYVSTDNEAEQAALSNAVKSLYRKTAVRLIPEKVAIADHCTVLLANQFTISAQIIYELNQQGIKCDIIVMPKVEKTLLTQVLNNRYKLNKNNDITFLDLISLYTTNQFLVEKFKSDLTSFNPQATPSHQAFKGYLLAKITADSIYNSVNKVQTDSFIDLITLPFQVLDQVVGWVVNPKADATRATVVNSFSYLKNYDIGLSQPINITKDRIILTQPQLVQMAKYQQSMVTLPNRRPPL